MSATADELAGTPASDPPAPDGVHVNGHAARSESVGQAAERVVDAARALLLDHLALAILEAKAVARGVVSAAALGIAGALFLAATWALALATLYHYVGDTVAPWMRLGGITAVTGIVGVALIAVAARQLRR